MMQTIIIIYLFPGYYNSDNELWSRNEFCKSEKPPVASERYCMKTAQRTFNLCLCVSCIETFSVPEDFRIEALLLGHRYQATYV